MTIPAADPIRHLLDSQPPHPIAALPGYDEAHTIALSSSKGMDQLQHLLDMRRKLIALSESDPLQYGYELASWKRAEAQIIEGSKELFLLGGNRSSKTEYCARKVVRTLLDNEEQRVWCFRETLKVSVGMQQARIYHYLPPQLRNIGKQGRVTKISYSQSTGFSNQTFVLPNRSQCWFMLYGADDSQLEGEELDLAWCDELAPLRIVKLLRYRVATRDGLLLVSFTPVKGHTPTVREAVTGSTTIEEVEAKYLPIRDRDANGVEKIVGYEKMPLVKQGRRDETRIVYFHTEENPFAPPDQVVAKVDLNNREEVMVRLYGHTEKPVGNLFPRFRTDVHVVDFFVVSGQPDAGTWYHVVDPCNGRNFFMIWAWVNANGQTVIAREWPQEGDYIEDVGYPGPWTEQHPEKLDGKAGPAQDPWGLTLSQMKSEIERVEKELGSALGLAGPIDINERIMDSRFGNTPTLSKSENTTLIEDFEELDLFFEPAPGDAGEGVTEINDLLGWDQRKERGHGNEPSLYVVRNCTNTIWMFENYTGKDGPKGAAKDPFDVVKYLVKSDPLYHGDEYDAPMAGPVLG